LQTLFLLRFENFEIDTVIAPAVGGIVVAHAVGRALEVKAIFTERQNGEMVLRRGFKLAPGEKVLVVEDVITTGGSVKEVIKVVKEAGPNPCPPIVVGVGIGGTFDKAANLAKRAAVRPTEEPNSNPFYAELEKELTEEINKLGIGPQGFGGRTTALAVNIETYPTHIAGLPVAVNINCHAARHAEAEL